MKRSGIALVVMTLAISLLSPAFSASPPKTGEKCTSFGKQQSYKNYRYTCIRKSGKLVWGKGIAVKKETSSAAAPTPSPTSSPTPSTVAPLDPTPSPQSTPSASAAPTRTPITEMEKFDWAKMRSTDAGYINAYSGPCDAEQDLSGTFAEVHAAYYSHTRCGGIYRVAQYELGTKRPKTELTSSNNDLAIRQCQISEPRDSRNNRGFFHLFEPGRVEYTNQVKVPGPNMSIQVIPIYAADTAKVIKSPKEDYGAYLDFLADWAKYSSDGESKVSVKFPERYLEFPGKVSEYSLFHENNHNHPEHAKFVETLVPAVDPYIDFTGINVAIVVVPPGTPLNVFQQATIKPLRTKEGVIQVGTTEYPITLSGLNTIKFSNFLVPFWWIHELYHSGLGLDDHYGDTKFNVNTEYGLGHWTLMTPWGGDLSAWEKWIVGFITDKQVHCLNVQQSVTRWIAPSSVKTSEKKLMVIPISQSKGIVIESVRAAGLYYKIPKTSEGVLVYEVDLNVVGHGLGLKLILPTNRNPNRGTFFLAEGSLREGESVQSNGYRITVVESGTFGDVIRVERA